MAFVSYRHADNAEEDRQWATWLHQQLEVYEIPGDLIGTTNLRGERIPDRIYPVFRDEVSLPANADLTTSIVDALDQSQFLIVLCSPRAVQSRYVNEEILHFKRAGKSDRVMAGIILGEPNASIDDSKTEDPEDVRTLECFPKTLQHSVAENGELDLSTYVEPIAANFRLPDGSKGLTSSSAYGRKLVESGTDKSSIENQVLAYEEQLNNAKLKIVAGIIGVRLEKLTQRDKLYQLNKARADTKRFRRIAAVMTTLAVVAAVTSVIAFSQSQEAKRSFAEARSVVDEFITDISREELADIPGFQEQREQFSQKAVDRYTEFLKRSPGDPEVLMGYASARSSRAIIVGAIGSTEDAVADFEAAITISRSTVAEHPKINEYQLELATRQFEFGRFLWSQQRYEESITVAADASKLLEALSEHSKIEPDYTYIRAAIYNLLGNSMRSLQYGNQAETYYQRSIETGLKVVDNPETRLDTLKLLSAGYHNLSLVKKSSKEYALSLSLLDKSDYYMKLLQSSKKTGPDDVSNLAIGLHNRSVLMREMGDSEGAQSLIEAAIEEFHALVKSNPQVTEYNWLLADSRKSYARLLTSIGQYDAARNAYQESAAVLEDLVNRADDRPHYGIALVQVYQSLSQFYGGDKGSAPRNEDKWRNSLEQALQRAKLLAEKYPANYDIQFALSNAHHKVGVFNQDVLKNDEAAFENFMLAVRSYSLDAVSFQKSTESWEIQEYLQFAESAGQVAKRLNRLDDMIAISDRALAAAKSHASMGGLQSLASLFASKGRLLSDNNEKELAVEALKQAISIAEPVFESTPWNWWLRQVIGGNYRKLFELNSELGNTSEAIRNGFQWLQVWGEPMHGVNRSELLDIEPKTASTAQLKQMSEVVLKEYGLKRFTIPSDFGGVKYPFHVYVTNVPWPTDPLADQARWLLEMRGGIIPEDVRESFRKLHKIAHENDISFIDLVAYALENAKQGAANAVDENEAK